MVPDLLSYFLIRFINLIVIAQLLAALPIYFNAAFGTGSDAGGIQIDPLILHLVGNILLALSINLALFKWTSLKIRIIISCCIAALAEFGQLLVPTRHFDWLDLLANALGLVVGFLLFIMFKYVINRFSVEVGLSTKKIET